MSKQITTIYHMKHSAYRNYLVDMPYQTADERVITLRRATADGDYVRCATIETDNLEAAWQLTNNIDAPWTEGDKVAFKASDRQRSSMTGDIFVKDGVAYMVAMVGFEELPQEIANFLRFAEDGVGVE